MDIDVSSCPERRKCSGCQISNLKYSEQLALKQRIAVGLLGEFGHVEDIIGMERPYRYRDKLQAVFGFQHGKIISGVWQSKEKRIVAVDDCYIEDEESCRIVVTIRRLMRDFKLTAYDMYTGRGFLRSVMVRRGFNSGEILVSMVGATPIFPSKNNFIKALRDKHPSITTVVFSVSNDDKALMPGVHETALYGSGSIVEEMLGLKFQINANSFYQVNPVQTEILYDTAVNYAGLTGHECVIDAYCGIGTIGLIAAKNAAKVYGIESNVSAVKNAIANCKLNGIKNARFYKGDAGEMMREYAESGEKCDVVFTDPPRAGCSSEFLSSLLSLSPSRIVYISCNPETQRRDLNVLTGGGYSVKRIQPVDMFPHTKHVECVVLMTRIQK